MAKTANKKQRQPKPRTILVALSIVTILAVGTFGLAYKIQTYDMAAKQAGLVSIRELIIRGIEATLKNVPLDHKTGDAYFPEAKLYLPYDENTGTLTYFYFKDAETEQLTVSSSGVLDTQISRLYSANDIDELFEHVPKAQACSRGVTLQKAGSADDIGSSNQLVDSVDFSDGQTWQIYLANDCSELSDLANLLKNIRKY